MGIKRLIDVFWLLRGRKEGRFVRHYFVALAISISGGVLTGGLLEIYYQYRESWDLYGRIQKEIANATAFKIERFIGEIEDAMKAATKSREIVRDGLTPEYKWELRRLLVNTSAITEAVAFDLVGDRGAQASRISSRQEHDKWALAEAWKKFDRSERFFGKVYFSGTGPYMTLAVPIDRVAGHRIGVLVAEIDLKYIGQLMSNVRVGKAGRAYLVDSSGQLIAHPDLSLVLQRPKLSEHALLRAAFGTPEPNSNTDALVTRNLEGEKVFASHAPIPGLDWVVFVEQPVREIYTSLYASALRTAVLFLVGLVLAVMATLLTKRRIVQPLEALRDGVRRIRQGDLTGRLELKTGDEIEILADEFNAMAENLRGAYVDLERKVAERTNELRTLNLKLADASKHKSQFLANVNHELRTPLSSIIGYARLIRRESEGQISSLQRENLEDLLRNAERLLGLIDSLLDFAKIEAGKTEVQIEAVRTDELIHGAASTIEAMLDEKAVKLVRNVSVAMPMLHTDREKLRQIIINLLGNAVKFTEQGEIRISASQQNGNFKLAIADTGIGIDQADIDRIFEEFDRGHLTNKGSYRGTGLGLAIVKKLVDVLGGSIAVESAVGKGSTFTVTLPVNEGSSTNGK